MCRRRNFAADAVTSDITLYAKWTEASTGNKEIKFEGIEKVEIPEGAIELSEDEKAAIAAGRTVYINVKAKEQEPSSEEVKKAIEEKAKERIEEYGAISFYDISVYTQIEGELDRRDVHDTKGEITITMKRLLRRYEIKHFRFKSFLSCPNRFTRAHKNNGRKRSSFN